MRSTAGTSYGSGSAPLRHDHGVEHRLTKPQSPWAIGQAERTVRTTKDASVDATRYTSIAELCRQVGDWLAAYNFARKLRAPKWGLPVKVIAAVHAQKPDVFLRPLDHFTPGPNTQQD